MDFIFLAVFHSFSVKKIFLLIKKPDLLEKVTNEEHINLFAKMLSKSNENKLDTKINRLLKIIYESVVQETFDFVGIMLLLDKVKKFF
jgi:hypothetical protein